MLLGGGEFTPPDEDEIRRLEEMRGHQMDEMKRTKLRWLDLKNYMG